MNKTLLKLLILLIIGPFLLFPQNSTYKEISQYVRQTWQADDGLPSNSITAITQTQDGYMWFGSNSGLIRFDGVNFVSFKSTNTKGLDGDDIWCLKTDSKGRMWIGTNGSGLTYYENGKFYSYSTEDGLSENAIWSITEDRNGNIWIGTGGGGINVFDGKKFNVIDTSDGLSNNYIWTILEDESGSIWAGTDGGYLNKINKNKIEIFNSNDGYPGSYTMAGFSGRNNTLWFGAAGTGVISYSKGKFKAYTISDGLTNDIIWSIFEDSKNNLWIGTDDGINKLSNGRFTSFTEKDGLQSTAVSSIYEDFEGNIWGAVKGGGITKFKDGTLTTFTRQQGLSNNNVYSVLSDRYSNLWFCTSKGLTLFRKDGGSRIFSASDGLDTDVILSISEGRNGRIWLGTDGGGIYLFENAKFINIDISNFVPSNSVLSLYEDKNGTLWMGTDGYGVLNYTNGKFDWFTMDNGLSGEYISCIYEDSHGQIWAGSSDGTGLNKIIGDTAVFYTVDDGLLANDIWSVWEDHEKSIWVTTPNGLNKIKDDKIYSYTDKQGLPDVVFYSVIDDNLGNLWLSSNSGIYRINKTEIEKLDKGTINRLNVLSFGTADGMRSAQCNRGFPPATKTKEGLLWFPTIKGAVCLNPGKLNLNKRKPNVLIENIKVNGVLHDNLNENIFQPGTGDLEFYFTALSFSAIEKINFKYKLEGWDENWLETNNRRSAFYTNLPPGTYKFKVMACNDAGLWNVKGASFQFELLPHFYETWWFFLLCASLISSGIYGLFIIRTKQLKKNEIILEQKIHERTGELENINIILNNEIKERKIIENALQSSLSEKEVMLKEIHHRVKNNLQIISSLLYLNSRKIKDIEAQTVFEESQNRIKSIALVHEGIYQCKNLDKIDLKEYVVKITNELSKTYMKPHENIRIQIDIEDIFLDTNAAIPCALIINELVSNSFKYAFPNVEPDEKEIDIKSKRVDENHLLLLISDNGAGLPADFEEKRKSSLGIHLVERLIYQLDGTIEYNSSKGASFRILVKA